MATTDKNFKVKNGLDVAGTATFDSTVVLGSTPFRYDTVTGRLQVQVSGSWKSIALLADAEEQVDELSFMDIGLAIDYDGKPIYTIQANGVLTSATKVLSGGNPETTGFKYTFDSGSIG